MAQDWYIGVGGKARRVVAAYIGVNGKARRITSGYFGVGGKARQFFSDGILEFDRQFGPGGSYIPSAPYKERVALNDHLILFFPGGDSIGSNIPLAISYDKNFIPNEDITSTGTSINPNNVRCCKFRDCAISMGKTSSFSKYITNDLASNFLNVTIATDRTTLAANENYMFAGFGGINSSSYSTWNSKYILPISSDFVKLSYITANEGKNDTSYLSSEKYAVFLGGSTMSPARDRFNYHCLDTNGVLAYQGKLQRHTEDKEILSLDGKNFVFKAGSSRSYVTYRLNTDTLVLYNAGDGDLIGDYYEASKKYFVNTETRYMSTGTGDWRAFVGLIGTDKNYIKTEVVTRPDTTDDGNSWGCIPYWNKRFMVLASEHHSWNNDDHDDWYTGYVCLYLFKG